MMRRPDVLSLNIHRRCCHTCQFIFLTHFTLGSEGWNLPGQLNGSGVLETRRYVRPLVDVHLGGVGGRSSRGGAAA
jgi:hypothetical protein